MKLRILGLSLAIAFGVTSCKKYEEDSGIKLSSPKSRVVNTWTHTETVEEDGTVQQGSNAEMIINKDGSYRSVWGSFTQEGTWALTDDNEKIIITYTSGNVSVSDSTQIYKLDKSEFWLLDDGDVIKYSAPE